MTFGKASILALGFAGAVALGVWASPYVRGEREFPSNVSFVKGNDAARTADATSRNVTRSARAGNVRSVAVSAPVLHQHLQPLLNRGARMTIAADGFRSAEQFAAVAHAAKNTEVPFMLLKHRVLSEGKSLEQAIRQSKPDIDASAEADRARAAARADISRLSRES